MKYLSILRCAKHGYNAIAIEEQDGSGLRVTPGKCCGSWQTVQRWPLSESMVAEIKLQLPGLSHEEITGATFQS